MKAERGGLVNPDCPNASNPFHRCADYCAVAPPPPQSPAQNKFHNGERKEENGRQQRRPERENAGSHTLPLYVFLNDELPAGVKKVDPSCPNASNPFHVCTDYCLTKMTDVHRSEAGKSPPSLFARHSQHSSASDEGSGRMRKNRKVDPRCPNASNPFHQCSDYCFNENSQGGAAVQNTPKREKNAQHLVDNTDRVSSDQNTLRMGKDKQPIIEYAGGGGSSGRSGASSSHTWKVDPRCPNASNPFHICAQYCFDELNERDKKSTSVPRKNKAVTKVGGKGEVHPECVNASNPFHKCAEYCVTVDRS